MKTVKEKAQKQERARLSNVRWPVVWAGLAGLLLIGVALLLRLDLKQSAFSTDLIAKLPSDARVAGLARLSTTTPDEVKRVANAAKIESSGADLVAQTVSTASVSTEQLTAALDDRYSFARTPRGDLAIFTIKDAGKAKELGTTLRNRLGNPTTSPRDGASLTVGTVGEPAMPVAFLQDGMTIYLSTKPELIDAARHEQHGFNQVERYDDVENRLPGNADGYVFLNPADAPPGPAGSLPLVGISWDDAGNRVDLEVATGTSSRLSKVPSQTSGDFLPNADLASFSVQAANLGELLRILEEQRQEQDVPSVIRLQTGLGGLSRTLGLDLEHDYFDATSAVVYGRYPAEAGPQWMIAVDLGDAPTTAAKTANLEQAVRTKLTLPVRKEIVRILPDGTQSREVVSEGREAPGFGDFTVEGRSGHTTALPGVGEVFFLTVDRYFVVGSSQDAVARMARNVTITDRPETPRGHLAVRLKLADVAVLNDPDLFGKWLFAARPQSGRFELDKATGVLTGAVDFAGTP